MHYEYKTSGVCSQLINFDIEDGKLHNISFFGGCNGNLKAISKLCEGMTTEDVVAKLEGNICGMRSTSCADQFAKAIEEACSNE